MEQFTQSEKSFITSNFEPPSGQTVLKYIDQGDSDYAQMLILANYEQNAINWYCDMYNAKKSWEDHLKSIS